MRVQILQKNASRGFYLLEGINRPIIPSQVTKLAESINKMGIIRPVVVCKTSIIDGSMKTYILDGQHLYSACLRNNSDIPYVETEVTSKADLIEKIALLNSSSKSWIISDYLQSWGSIKEDYKELLRLVGVYDIEASIIAGILHGASSGGTISRIIKKGLFSIKNKEEKLVILDQITDILKSVPRMSRWDNKYFVGQWLNYRSTCGTYNHPKLIKYLKAHKTELLLATQDPEEMNKLFANI